MKRKKILLTCLSAFVAASAWAQGPNGSGIYYRDADGKSGQELKTALHAIISKKTKSPSYDDFIELYKITDTRSDGKVRDWYSNITNYVHVRDKAGSYKKEGDVYNREHLVPQDWGASKAGDIMYVVPTDGYVNGQRSNLPFGEVGGTPSYQSANGYSKVGQCKTAGYSGKVFEPNDEVKGDIARIYFYMATCYEGTAQNWSGSMFTGTVYQPLAAWAYDMLVRWSQLDPVDSIETARNNAIARADVQGNRNPFVDYPGLEEYIWGTMKGVAFSFDNYDGSGGELVQRVEQPVFSPYGGTFNDKVDVTISCATEGATIYYTTNGVEASANSLIYDGPIMLTETTTLKAIAVKEGLSTSYQQTAQYIIIDSSQANDTTGITIALNNAAFGTTASGSLSGTALHDYTATKDGITVTYSKGSGSNMFINDSQLRLYPGNTLTVSSSTTDITWAQFTLVLNKNGKTMLASTGNISDLTWTGSANSVTFSVDSGSGHMQLSKLKVKRKKVTPQPVVGDVNGDGSVDVADIAAVITVMAGDTGASTGTESADVNGDGSVDVADISAIITIMAGN